MTRSQNIQVGGAGTYSWFSTYTPDCIDVHSCHKVLWHVKGNYENVRLQHLIAIGAEYMLVSHGKGISSADNLAIEAYPAWAQISIFDVPSHGKAPVVNTCDFKDHPWANITMREGQYCDKHELGKVRPSDIKLARMFVTIVNLTPYNFKYLKDQSHTYQMEEWDFDDIPFGRAWQCVMEYIAPGSHTVNAVDDKGEAYFKVEGTDHKFNIKARTHLAGSPNFCWRTVVDLSGWGLGQREFKDPHIWVPVTLVIAPSNDYNGGQYFTMSKDSAGPVGWMEGLSMSSANAN